MSSSILKNIVTLATGSIASSAVMALSIPLLSRVYSPEEFGVFGVYLSVAGLVCLFGGGKIESALMLTSNKNERALILKTSALIISVVAMIVLPILLIFSNQFKDYLGTESIIPVLLIVPGILAMYGHKFATNNANSNREYGKVSKGMFYRAVIIVTLQLLLSYLLDGVYGLIIGSITSYVFYVFYFCLYSDLLNDFNKKKISVLKGQYILGKYRRMYLHLLPQSILNYISQQLPFLIFPLYYESKVLGGLFVAQRLLKMPAGIMTMALRNVFYPHFRDLDSDALFKSYVKLTLGLFVVGFPIAIVLYNYIAELVVLILGEGWAEAGHYSQYLIFWVFMSVVNVTTTPALTIISANKLLLNFEFTDFIVKTTTLLYCLNAPLSAIETVFYYSIVCSVSYAVICAICTYRLFLNKNRYFK